MSGEGVKKIIFYDGVCGFCDRFISFVAKHNAEGEFYFAPLQGITAKNILGDGALDNIRSVVLRANSRTYVRSSAAIRIVATFGGVWNLARIFLIIPSPLRDFCYNLVAKNRYQWFGKKGTCEIPNGVDNEHYLP